MCMHLQHLPQSVRPSVRWSVILSGFHSVSASETSQSIDTTLWWPTWWLTWWPTWRWTWWPTWRWTWWPTRSFLSQSSFPAKLLGAQTFSSQTLSWLAHLLLNFVSLFLCVVSAEIQFPDVVWFHCLEPETSACWTFILSFPYWICSIANPSLASCTFRPLAASFLERGKRSSTVSWDSRQEFHAEEEGILQVWENPGGKGRGWTADRRSYGWGWTSRRQCFLVFLVRTHSCWQISRGILAITK